MKGAQGVGRKLREIPKLAGWRRAAAAVGFGALMGFAYAPLRWPFMLAIGLSGLALLLEGTIGSGRPRRTAFLTGTLFGASFFAVTTVWLANAFLVQADAFGWMIPIVLPVFFVGMGLFYGLAALIHVTIRRRIPLAGVASVLPLALGLALAEWLRGHVLSGFPWNLHAQTAAASTLTLQPLAVLGPYAYGLLLSVLALLPAGAILHPQGARRAGIGLLASLSVLLGYGALRLALLPAEMREDARVVVVQPNVPQRDKLERAKVVEALRRNVAVSTEAAGSGREGESVYVVWPENAFPFLNRLVDLPEVLQENFPEDAYLVSGSIRRVEEGYANTLMVFGPAGEGGTLRAAYDKHRLVPFAETLPFYEVFEALGIESLSPAGGGGFTAGPGPRRLAYGRAPFAPLICYEDVFPDTLYPEGERPDWLVVITNDAWFGDAAGPMQHLDIARMRAVETGLPVARSANTGISALIDAEGRLVNTLPLYEDGVITANLPASRRPTVYARTGELFLVLSLTLIAMIIFKRRVQ